MEEEIDLLELFYAFWKKKFVIMVFVILGLITGFLYTKFLVTPKYSSNVTMILAKAESAGTSASSEDAITQSDIVLNQKLISTYGEIMQSKRVANKVIKALGLNVNASAFKKYVSVSSVKDTDIIKFSVTTTNAEQSQKIAEELFDTFSEEVERIYNIKNVSKIDEPEVNNVPVNVNYSKNMIIFAALYAMIVCAVIFILYYFDNTIKSTETIQKITELPVLASIPKTESK